MLKQRVLTAAILAPLIIWSVLDLSTDIISVIFGVFILLGAWEWSRLIGLTRSAIRVVYVVVIALLLLLTNYLRINYSEFVFMLLLIGVVWWILGVIWVITYKGKTGLLALDTSLGLLIGIVVLIPCWLAMTHIHGFAENGPAMLLFVMMLIWSADIGAYFAGRKFGKHKLAPMVSPGKTIEGVIGGLLAATLFSLFGAVMFDLPTLGVFGFVILSAVVVLFSVVGDLLESLFKRRVGIKDSGQILPGHGGVLDRIDSLTAAAPMFAFGLAVFEGVK